MSEFLGYFKSYLIEIKQKHFYHKIERLNQRLNALLFLVYQPIIKKAIILIFCYFSICYRFS